MMILLSSHLIQPRQFKTEVKTPTPVPPIRSTTNNGSHGKCSLWRTQTWMSTTNVTCNYGHRCNGHLHHGRHASRKQTDCNKAANHQPPRWNKNKVYSLLQRYNTRVTHNTHGTYCPELINCITDWITCAMQSRVHNNILQGSLWCHIQWQDSSNRVQRS